MSSVATNLKTLSKPTGITGNDKPYPLNLWAWTRKEFTDFLDKWHFPPCTYRDRLTSHEQAVYEAVAANNPVPSEVLADYPGWEDEAAWRRGAQAAWQHLHDTRSAEVSAFRAQVERDGSLPQFVDAIRKAGWRKLYHHNARYIATSQFEVGGQPYWAELYHIPDRHHRFGVDLGRTEWHVWSGAPPLGAALEPLLRIDHALLSTKTCTVHSSSGSEDISS